MRTKTTPRPDLAIQLAIFLAGFTFLVLEVSWNRQLALILGSTVTATTLVLSTFMAGFGTGAFVWGRVANEKQQIGRMLGLLLAGVGLVSALDFFLITRLVPLVYTSLGDSLALAEILAFLITAGLLFIPAFLMGGVFPLASKVAVSVNDTVSTTLGRLYAMETLGSALGGLITGFILLGVLGQQWTLMVAVVINLGLAGWLISRGDQVEEDDELPEAPSRPSRKTVPVDPVSLRRVALLGAFVCGLAMLSLQVIWQRMFQIYLINTTYTFALISSLVVLGIFAGSKLFERRAPEIKDQQHVMMRMILLVGLTTGVGLVLLINFPELFMFPFQSVLEGPMARVLLLPVMASLLIAFPPALCSGFAFPLACSMVISEDRDTSRDVGFVLMVNTLGAMVGPLLAAFVLLPWLGAVRAIMVVLVVLSVAAVLVQHQRRQMTGRNGFLALTVGLLILMVAGPTMRIMPPSFSRFDREVLFYLESVEGTLTVGKDRTTRAQALHTYVNNSAVIGGTYDAIKVVKMVGHFPFFLGHEIRDALVIGFGIGVTTSAIAAHPEVESIECVELVKGLKDAAVFYRDVNRNVVQDPRLEIIEGDGRHYLQKTTRTYDLISCDPTHPILGSGSLYTEDYFTMCRDHLNPGGVVSQYLPLHKLRTEEFLGIIHTFHSVFPHGTVWLGHYHAVLLGSRDPIEIDFQDWAANIEGLPADEHFYMDPYHLAATLMLDGEAIERLGADSKINTDDRSYTEFFAPACLDEDNIAKNLRFLQDNRVATSQVFTSIQAPAVMAQFVMGNQWLIECLWYQFNGDNRNSQLMLHKAIEANPDNQEFPFLMRLYF